jgi:hypothetical protein
MSEDLVTCPTCKSQVQRAALVQQCNNCGKDVKGVIPSAGDIYCSFECLMKKLFDSLGNMALVAQVIDQARKLGKEDGK